jgi:hypothetical protein
MAFFEDKEKITRKEFRKKLIKKNPIVPGTYKKMFSFEDKKKMEKRLFGRRRDATASADKYKQMVKELGRDKYKTKDQSKKREISKKIRFLKKLGGK